MTDELTPTLPKPVADALAAGKIALPDVLKAISPKETISVEGRKAPVPAVITAEQQKALDNLVRVFGSVQPTEARSLTPAEVSSLLEERLTLDQIDKLVEDRKTNIRTAVLNHIDETVVGSEVDKDGHVLVAEKVTVPEASKCFSWEISDRGSDLTVEALQQAVSHEEYLAMTDQVRVINPQKVLDRLKKNPTLVASLATATTPGKKVGSLYVRNAPKA